MNKLILLLSFLAFGLTSFTADNLSNKANETNRESLTCHYGRCQATAKSTGNQCKHCVSNAGDSYCWQHK